MMEIWEAADAGRALRVPRQAWVVCASLWVVGYLTDTQTGLK